MAKRYRRLQHISTIPILAALLLSSNPGAVVDQPSVTDVSPADNGTDISIQMDGTDTRLRGK
jgi:hypothetical protein